MDYILAFVIFSADCKLSQISNFECKPLHIDYTDIITNTRKQCDKKAVSPITKQIILENYRRVWVVPSCQAHTREVEIKITYYINGV